MQIENIGIPSVCLDTQGRPSGEPIGVERCHAKGGNQIFIITDNDEIRVDMSCLDANEINKPVITYPCHFMKGNQKFSYDKKVMHLSF